MLQNRKLVIAGAIGIVAVLVIIFFVARAFWPAGPQEVSMSEPTDVLKDFYNPWLAAALSTTTNPYRLGLADDPILSPELRKHIKKTGRDKDALDPVLCQPVIPPEFSTRTVFQTAEATEILVMARPSGPPEQAIVTLLALNGGWYIDDIRCSPGEVPPDREFSFDNEGFLLKQVPPPLNPQNWHLIFSENDEAGHFAPLFFGPESMCTVGGKTEVCAPDTLPERGEAHVQGEMTETGVMVKKLQLK